MDCSRGLGVRASCRPHYSGFNATPSYEPLSEETRVAEAANSPRHGRWSTFSRSTAQSSLAPRRVGRAPVEPVPWLVAIDVVIPLTG